MEKIQFKVAQFSPESAKFARNLVAQFSPESLAQFSPESVAQFGPE